LTVGYEPLAGGARLIVDATPRASSTVTQDNERLIIRFDADALDVPNPPLQPPNQTVVQAVRALDTVTLGVDVAPRFGGFKTSSQPVENTTRLVIDILGPPATETSPGAAPSTTAPAPAPAPVNPPDVS